MIGAKGRAILPHRRVGHALLNPPERFFEGNAIGDVRDRALPISATRERHDSAGFVSPTLGRSQEVVVVHRVHLPGQNQLLLVARAGCTGGFRFRLGQGRQEHTGQNRDDGNDDQQLDQGETAMTRTTARRTQRTRINFHEHG